MNVLILGASGMVGSGVLLECLDDPAVTSVLALGRRACGVAHPKLRELLHADFFDFSGLGDALTGLDACFFCLGVSAAGKSEAEYHRLTYDLTTAFADTFLRASPGATFCYVSGAGTDSTEKGRAMWARVKGKTENHLLKMPFAAVRLFRPGYIQPMRGVRSSTGLYQAFYTAMSPLYPLLKRLAPRHVTTTEILGRAMIRVASEGYPKAVLDPPDINALGQRIRAAGAR